MFPDPLGSPHNPSIHPMNRATLQLIADQAGVSKMTVSRALRNHPNCGKKTMARIHSIALELGYKKHPLVSALMTNLRYKKESKFKPIIALLHLDQKKEQLHPNLKNMRVGARESATIQGYDVEEFYLADLGMTTRRIMQIFNARGIHAIIFEHSSRPNIELDIDLSGYACVATKYSISKPVLNRIETSQFSSILMSVERLKTYGYKSFGLVVPTYAENISEYRRTAATLFAQKNLPEQERIPILESEAITEKALVEWMETNGPEVVISPNLETYDLLKKQGYRIPKDVAFIHQGLYQFDGSVAGINPNWMEMGRIAANQVIDQLNRNDLGVPKHPIVTLVEGEWVDGATLPDKRITHPETQAEEPAAVFS
jgi:LacI family transcriptional regulator